jgi:hypothetical protein
MLALTWRRESERKVRMGEFVDFLEQWFTATGLPRPSLDEESEVDLAAATLRKLNEFLYQQPPTRQAGYISPFHEFWERWHREVISPSIDRSQCQQVSRSLAYLFAHPGEHPKYELTPPIDRCGLPDEAVADVRFFTVIQDFKIHLYKQGRNPFAKYCETPEWFDARAIVGKPALVDSFLSYLEARSQGDKRRSWMMQAARFLVDNYGGKAYLLLDAHDGDADAIKTALCEPGDIGYSEKKANLFLRDMADWHIWCYRRNYDKVDVASDANTMRIALRTGILTTRMPLVASYLDVYCHQYSLIDEWTSRAWRTVWEEWRRADEGRAPPTPASMDFVLYSSIGRRLCRRSTPKCELCLFDDVCPTDRRILNPPKSISIYGATGWESGKTNAGGGGGIMS